MFCGSGSRVVCFGIRSPGWFADLGLRVLACACASACVSGLQLAFGASMVFHSFTRFHSRGVRA